jgi:hypothetical protein
MKNIFRYSLWMLLLPAQVLLCQAQKPTDTARHSNIITHADTTRHPVDSTKRLDSSAIPRLAIFAPLYLDSAFDAAGNYRYEKNFPKFINPGLEFYEGVQWAIDSLEHDGVRLEVQVYDTRSGTQSIKQVLDDSSFQRTALILGDVLTAEMQQMAAFAARKNIPFINVNYPNDGGISNNPDFIILNSTLRTHCEGIYRFLQRNFPTKAIVYFGKKGSQEDRLKGYFANIEKTTASVPLKIKYVTLDDNFDAAALARQLDSNVHTVCIAGSLDDNFCTRMCGGLSSLKGYHTTIIGMPTWDNTDFTRPEFAGDEIYYSTPFYINQTDTLVKLVLQNFKNKFYSRPSDMFFRGYECMYRFGRLLADHGGVLAGSVGEKKYKVFTDFDIEPVFLNRDKLTLDYFENKKLYFIRKVDGNITGIF